MIRPKPLARLDPRFALVFIFVFTALIPHRYLVLPGSDSAFDYILLLIRFLPVAVISLLIASCVFREGLPSVLRSMAASPGAIWLACLVVSGTISIWNATNPAFSFTRTLYYFPSGILLYFLFLHHLRKESEILSFSLVIFFSGVAVGVYGILEFFIERNILFEAIFTADNPLYYQLAQSGYKWRILSTIGHPVYAGTFLMVCLPLGLYHYVVAPSLKAKSLWSLGIAVVMITLFLTFTRGAWIGALASLFFVLRRHSRVYKLLILIILVGSVGIFVQWDRMLPILRTRNPWNEVGREDAFGFRVLAYWHASKVVEKQPLFGMGTGNYRYLPRNRGEQSDTPDNMYLRILAENGLFGLVSLVAVFAFVLRACLVGSRKVGASGDLSWAFGAGFVGFYIDMLTCDALYFPTTRILFWSLAGLGVGLSNIETEDKQRIP